jgi:hypothetical protein
MSAKKATKQAKKQPHNPNVIIPPIDDDAEPIKENDAEPVTQNLNDNYQSFPVPTESAGKGRKYCPNCNFTMGARSTTCPNCNWQIVKGAKSNAPKGTRTRTSKEETSLSPISEDVFVKVLAGKGFNFVRLVNSITGEVVKEESDKKIEALGSYQFKSIPRNADNDSVYVIQTANQIQVAMSLDKFLSVTKTKP